MLCKTAISKAAYLSSWDETLMDYSWWMPDLRPTFIASAIEADSYCRPRHSVLVPTSSMLCFWLDWFGPHRLSRLWPGGLNSWQNGDYHLKEHISWLLPGSRLKSTQLLSITVASLNCFQAKGPESLTMPQLTDCWNYCLILPFCYW